MQDQLTDPSTNTLHQNRNNLRGNSQMISRQMPTKASNVVQKKFHLVSQSLSTLQESMFNIKVLCKSRISPPDIIDFHFSLTVNFAKKNEKLFELPARCQM